MPAKAGIQNYLRILDSRLRGNDVKGCIKTFYDTIIIRHSIFSFSEFLSRSDWTLAASGGAY